MHLKNQRLSALFIFLFVTGMFVSSCFAEEPVVAKGSPDDVLAEIGDEKVTRALYDAELANFLAMANPQAAAHFATPEGKKGFLSQITEINVLQKKAEQQGLNKGEKYEADFHETAVARLAAESMQKLVSAVEVKEEEAKDFYEKNKSSFAEAPQYHIFQITLNSAEKAAEVKKQLDSGKSFVEIAKSESIDKFKADGGDNGFVAQDRIEPEVLSAVSSLKQDEVSGPVKIADDMYLLVKYTEKKEGSIKEYSAVSAQIIRDLTNKKQQEAYEAEVERLKKEMSFEMNQVAAESLRKEALTEEEKNAVLFKFMGKEAKEVKVAELDQELQQIPPFIRPQILGGEGLNDFLKQFYSRHLATANAEKSFEALSQKYPEVIKDVARRTVVKALLDEKIGSIVVDDKEIEEHYQKNLADFAQPAQMKAHHILVKEEAEAKDLLATLEKEPAKFEELAKAKSTCPSGKSGGDLGMFGEGQMVPEFDQACKTAEVGKVVGPVKTNFGYHIVRVDERQPAGTQKLDDAKDKIRAKLLPEKQKEAFVKFIEELKTEFKVKLYQEKL
ncbi:MAG: peptidyl-prolyl cis-trans isomerase [Candidatus Riflebacteria bacterium]|nr:peptidyl-prolyl cis-trans isomerase [Candidatus Riflebacteria bacterium]